MSTAAGLRFYLLALKPKTVLSGVVDGDPADPFMDIDYDGGATGTVGAPVAGNTVWFGTSAGGKERGTLRLRSWSPSGPTGTAGALSVAESDDVGPTIADGDHITVKQEWRLWPVDPRTLEISDTEVQFFEDYDIAYTNQTVLWKPTAVPGPPAVAFLEGSVATVDFVGDRSFELAPASSLTTHLWTAHGSVEGTSSSQGTEGAPVSFTWTGTAPGQYDGQYLVSLQETDSNGKDHTSYTWAFVIDANDEEGVAYTDFSAFQDSGAWESGGGECSFVVHSGADVSEFPEGTLVVLAARGDITTATGSWPFRTNVAFVGYITEGTIRQNPSTGDVSFRARTIDGLMRNTRMFPVSLTDRKGPKDWTQASTITVDTAASFIWHWRSTLANMTSIIPLEYTPWIARQDFGPQDIYSEMQRLAANAWGRVVANHQSVLYLEHDYQNMLAAEQAGVTTRKTLHKGIWVGDVEIDERATYAQPVDTVKQEGIYYPGNEADVVPLFSEAPGDLPKPWGYESAQPAFILNDQADLNTRCGLELARHNQKYPLVRMRFINDGSFTIAPQEAFPAIIEAGDNDRGLAWQPTLIPRRVRRTYDGRLGYFMTEVEFEPSTTGEAGVTVTMPPEPPPNEIPPWDPPPPAPWPEPVAPAPGPAVAADGAMGVYWTLDSGTTWERRVNGLETDQLAFEDLIWDPWWKVKTGASNPEEVRLYGSGPGFVVFSDDAGKNWTDKTVLLDDPPNSWGDAVAPTAADLTYKQVLGTIHAEDTFYVLCEWESTGSAWRGWIMKTTDAFATQTYQALGATLNEPDANGYFWPIAIYDQVDAGSSYWEAATLAELLDEDNYGNQNHSSRQWVHGWDHLYVTLDYGVIMRTAAGAPYIDWKVWGDEADPLKTGEKGFRVSPDRSGGTWYPTSGDAFRWAVDTTWTECLTCSYGGTGGHPSNIDIRYIRIHSFNGDIFGNGWNYISAIGIKPDSYELIGSSMRPLWMDDDSEDGTRLYVTVWNNGTLYVQQQNASTLAKVRDYSFGAATMAEVEARTYHIVPRCPHVPETAGFGDFCYIVGRYDDSGTPRHVAYSNDGAASFSSIGDATWTSEQVGELEVGSDGLTLRAILNAPSPTLWESTDNGTTWSQINTIPFSVRQDALTRHWGASAWLMAGNITGSAQMAAIVPSPYTDAWTDATGPAGDRLPTDGDGGVGIVSIIWV